APTIAVLPSSEAGRLASAPLNEPMGVRVALAMTTSVMAISRKGGPAGCHCGSRSRRWTDDRRLRAAMLRCKTSARPASTPRRVECGEPVREGAIEPLRRPAAHHHPDMARLGLEAVGPGHRGG